MGLTWLPKIVRQGGAPCSGLVWLLHASLPLFSTLLAPSQTFAIPGGLPRPATPLARHGGKIVRGAIQRARLGDESPEPYLVVLAEGRRDLAEQPPTARPNRLQAVPRAVLAKTPNSLRLWVGLGAEIGMFERLSPRLDASANKPGNSPRTSDLCVGSAGGPGGGASLKLVLSDNVWAMAHAEGGTVAYSGQAEGPSRPGQRCFVRAPASRLGPVLCSRTKGSTGSGSKPGRSNVSTPGQDSRRPPKISQDPTDQTSRVKSTEELRGRLGHWSRVYRSKTPVAAPAASLERRRLPSPPAGPADRPRRHAMMTSCGRLQSRKIEGAGSRVPRARGLGGSFSGPTRESL